MHSFTTPQTTSNGTCAATLISKTRIVPSGNALDPACYGILTLTDFLYDLQGSPEAGAEHHYLVHFLIHFPDSH
jgi:hypothetical protein